MVLAARLMLLGFGRPDGKTVSELHPDWCSSIQIHIGQWFKTPLLKPTSGSVLVIATMTNGRHVITVTITAVTITTFHGQCSGDQWGLTHMATLAIRKSPTWISSFFFP